MKRTFSSLTLGDAMQLVPTDQLHPWAPETTPQVPSDRIIETLRRLEAFDLQTTEAAKLLLIDALLAETVPSFPLLKVWKGVNLDSEDLGGVADYLISPKYAFVKAPLLCAVEAKRDDFVQGLAQCVSEMVACRSNNRRAGLDVDIYGIVSNGNFWQFYKLSLAGLIYESSQLGLNDLPPLLGMLNFVCDVCARNVPRDASPLAS